MAQVYAGFLCGYALALLCTPLLAYALLHLRATSETLARLLPEGTSAVGLSVILHVGLFFFWTALGLLLGLVLLAMRGASGALGSANAAFTLFVAGLLLALAAPVIVVAPSLRRFSLAMTLLTFACFGYFMPYVARWAS